MKLSVVIPARNEEECLEKSVEVILAELKKEKIDHEIIVVNDNSTDRTEDILKDLVQRYPEHVRYINQPAPGGFGRAVSLGLANMKGDAVVTAMGDASDEPKDIVKYFRVMKTKNCDCVFGSRFIKGGEVKDYPRLKLFINRLANTFIKILFRLDYNDTTNAFKAYKAEVIRAISPLTSVHFNITVEIPLKAVVRGFSYEVVPISWYGRESGVSKHKIRELGKKYLYTTLTIWLEKLLLGDEFKKK
ncbi:MAG: glycosyltransferase family 2 protein [Candidatus Omnitrophota bacterium]